MTVLERLKATQTCQCGKDCDCLKEMLTAFPTLLALAEAVKAKDQQAMDKTLAELEKEATNGN